MVVCVLVLFPWKSFGAFNLAPNFDFYGFLKMDVTHQDSGMNSIFAPRYAKAGEATLNFTAMHSRFGFKWKGASIGKGWKIGAQLEWDLFDTGSRNQMKFRARHANFTLTNERGNFKILIGQYWDVFSPLGPTTFMTNGYLWQVGNLGFRRAQIRGHYKSKSFEFAASFNDPTSTAGTLSGSPVCEGRAGLILFGGNFRFGLSGAYGKNKCFAALYTSTVNVQGLSLDLLWRIIPQITLKGEYGFGENLGIFLSRSNVFDDTAAGQFVGQEVKSFWGEIVFEPVSSLDLWIGYSFENLTQNTQLAAGALQDTICIFAGIKYSVGGGFAMGVEYGNFESKYFQGPANSKTKQFMASFIYGF
jgi:hypothetical protein